MKLLIMGIMIGALSSGSITACSSDNNSGLVSAVGGGGGSHPGTGGSQASNGGAGGLRTSIGGSGGSAQIDALCNLEGQTAQQLNCPGFTTQQAMVVQCLQSGSAVPASCQPQVNAATACANQQPISSYQCTPQGDGTTQIKPGICTSETNALITCEYGSLLDGGLRTCTDLASCCAKLTGSTQTNCQQAVAAGIDAACGIALNLYQTLGSC